MIHRVAKGLIDRGGAGNVSHLSVLRVDVVPLYSLFSSLQLRWADDASRHVFLRYATNAFFHLFA